MEVLTAIAELCWLEKSKRGRFNWLKDCRLVSVTLNIYEVPGNLLGYPSPEDIGAPDRESHGEGLYPA